MNEGVHAVASNWNGAMVDPMSLNIIFSNGEEGSSASRPQAPSAKQPTQHRPCSAPPTNTQRRSTNHGTDAGAHGETQPASPQRTRTPTQSPQALRTRRGSARASTSRAPHHGDAPLETITPRQAHTARCTTQCQGRAQEHRAESARGDRMRRRSVPASMVSSGEVQYPEKGAGLNEDELKAAFGPRMKRIRRTEDITKDTLSEWELMRLARELHLTDEEFRMARLAFRNFDRDDNGSWDGDEYQKAIGHLLRRNEAHTMAMPSWRQPLECAKDKPLPISFRQFLVWYASNRFQKGVLLSEEQQLSYKLAEQYGVAAADVDHLKQSYDSFDQDHSGTLDYEEFKKVLHSLMRVPADTELPDSRVQRFWREVDPGRCGAIEFEVFLAWWMRQRRGLSHYEDFYKQVRNIGRQRPDPPAYASPCASLSEGLGALPITLAKQEAGVRTAAQLTMSPQRLPSPPSGQQPPGPRRPTGRLHFAVPNCQQGK